MSNDDTTAIPLTGPAPLGSPRLTDDAQIDPDDLYTAESAAFFFRQIAGGLQEKGWDAQDTAEGLVVAACNELTPFLGREAMARWLEEFAEAMRNGR